MSIQSSKCTVMCSEAVLLATFALQIYNGFDASFNKALFFGIYKPTYV